MAGDQCRDNSACDDNSNKEGILILRYDVMR